MFVEFPDEGGGVATPSTNGGSILLQDCKEITTASIAINEMKFFYVINWLHFYSLVIKVHMGPVKFIGIPN